MATLAVLSPWVEVVGPEPDDEPTDEPLFLSILRAAGFGYVQTDATGQPPRIPGLPQTAMTLLVPNLALFVGECDSAAVALLEGHGDVDVYWSTNPRPADELPAAAEFGQRTAFLARAGVPPADRRAALGQAVNGRTRRQIAGAERIENGKPGLGAWHATGGLAAWLKTRPKGA